MISALGLFSGVSADWNHFAKTSALLYGEYRRDNAFRGAVNVGIYSAKSSGSPAVNNRSDPDLVGCCPEDKYP